MNNYFTNQELAIMHLTYGAVGERGQRARQVYEKIDTLTEEYHNTKSLHVCIGIYENMVHCAAAHMLQGDADRQRKEIIEDRPLKIIRIQVHELLLSSSGSVSQLCGTDRVHPYHLQRVLLHIRSIWNLPNGSC
ncbi:hypothetical protein TNCV_2568171 [Trichonephila clavipes]|uniref:Uncharacterized protein n=1 Tax=Trichonephila clavipes TaxID=2585209 RepID=A0A8X7BMM5_TRICX|nr:hypothetical protein TNCV_2568171 [Trichonephila clavipes]